MDCVICKKQLLEKQKIYCSRGCNDKAYYFRHKKEIIKKNIIYQKNHPEQTKKINRKAMRKYIKNNLEKIKEGMRRQYEANKNKWLVRANTQWNRKKIFIKLGKRCVECGVDKNIEIHHVDYFWIKGNLDMNLNNFVVLCKSCHEKKHKDKLYK